MKTRWLGISLNKGKKMSNINQDLKDAYYIIHKELKELIDSDIGDKDKLYGLLNRTCNTLQTETSPMYAGDRNK